MSFAGIIAAITALGTIAGAFVYMFKTGVWIFKKPLAEKEQEITKTVEDEKHAVEQGERPKWDP